MKAALLAISILLLGSIAFAVTTSDASLKGTYGFNVSNAAQLESWYAQVSCTTHGVCPGFRQSDGRS